ncbi:hypothetical protein Moror_3712 [Moniliophthora roreri MCA 2997]|uniref:C2H2-type domain-containing protein n=2 Tax=Moniliophthora roreri TaxID=221103 RepID=V2WME6_MONRO|nr:hypothetical protein Moror_3712 [Moniliophthora roreri MCA 2997]
MCNHTLKNKSALTWHCNTFHCSITLPSREEIDDFEDRRFQYEQHTHLTAIPCDQFGKYLLPGAPPAPCPPEPSPDTEEAWALFCSQAEFNLAYFQFVELKASEAKIGKVLDILQSFILEHNQELPFTNVQEIGPQPEDPPQWMLNDYILCTRNSCSVIIKQLKMEDFSGQFNYTPYHQYLIKDSCRIHYYSNLLSGDWAWDEADKIAQDSTTYSMMFVPIVLRSNKTTVSVATGHQEYHPVYISPGNISNIARQSHGNGVLPVAFLPIPRSKPSSAI